MMQNRSNLVIYGEAKRYDENRSKLVMYCKAECYGENRLNLVMSGAPIVAPGNV